MKRPSSLALVVALLAGPLLLGACRDGGTLEPVGRRQLAGLYARQVVVALDPATTLVASDTIWISPEGHGSWTTWYTSNAATAAPTRFRVFAYELRGAELELHAGAGCPPNANCIAPEYVEPMRGVIRGDTLTLWHTGIHVTSVPAWYDFVRVGEVP